MYRSIGPFEIFLILVIIAVNVTGIVLVVILLSKHQKRTVVQGDTTDTVSDKSRLVVTLLAYFLGDLGIHRFYLGKIGTGVLMILTLGGLGIWTFVDFIMAVAGIMKDKDGKRIVCWTDEARNALKQSPSNIGDL